MKPRPHASAAAEASHPRRAPRWRAAAFVVAASLVGSLLGATGSTAAVAAEGPAPTPVDYAVVSDTHTDAIAALWEDGQLVLDSFADAPARHTRYDADTTWFHVDEDSYIDALPSGLEFVAPEGSAVWATPLAQDPDQLWPGFSTESIPSGSVDDDTVMMTLVEASGPGDVEVWDIAGFGTPRRMWSSDDEAYRSFTATNAHRHANWAFTAAGTYDLTVRADATVAGEAVSTTQVYTFVVGTMPEQVQTTTTLTASAETLTVEESVTLTATVAAGESTSDGVVEFRDGDSVLGHDVLDGDGTASLEVSMLGVGTHNLTARFVPEVANLASGSESDPLAVTVTDETGVPFGIAGLEESYQVGDTLKVQAAGYHGPSGPLFLYYIRPVGDTGEGLVWKISFAADGALTQVLDASYNGFEVKLQAKKGVDLVAESEWKPLTVENAVDPVTTSFESGRYFLGEDLVFPLERTLEEGEQVQLAYRTGTQRWTPVPGSAVSADAITARPTSRLTDVEFAVQVLEGKTVVAVSDPIAASVDSRDVFIEGLLPIYRPGQTLTATATVTPHSDALTYRWYAYVGGKKTEIAEGTRADAETIEVTVDESWNGSRLFFQAHAPQATGSKTIVTGSMNQTINVTDADADTQLFFFEDLFGHYHQSHVVHLDLVADPVLADGDTVSWEWKWPGDEWAPFPGASGLSHEMAAEQALDGVQVRATLSFASSDETMTAEASIHHDDHGSAPWQEPSIEGETEYTVGDTVTLTRALAENVTTSLTDHVWETKSPSGEWTTVAGASGPELSFVADAAHDEAEFRVSIMKPTGELAYGPSTAVSLTVGDAPDQGGGSDTGEPTDSDEMPATGGASGTAPATPSEESLSGPASGTITVSDSSVVPGQSVTIGTGKEKETVAVWMFSEPTLLGGGWLQTDASGAVTVSIPADATAGTHTLAVFDEDGVLVGSQEIEVSGALAVTGAELGGSLAATAFALLLAGAGALLWSRTPRRERLAR